MSLRRLPSMVASGYSSAEYDMSIAVYVAAGRLCNIIFALSIQFLIFTSLATAARLYTKTKILRKRMTSDDIASIFAMVSRDPMLHFPRLCAHITQALFHSLLHHHYSSYHLVDCIIAPVADGGRPHNRRTSLAFASSTWY